MPKDPDPTIIADQADQARKLEHAIEFRHAEPPRCTSATVAVTLTVTVTGGIVFGGDERIEDVHRFAAANAEARLAELISRAGRDFKYDGIKNIAVTLNTEPRR